MVSTIALMAVTWATPANIDKTDFTHKFVKGSKTTYGMALSGEDSGAELELTATVEVSVTDVSENGGASVSITVKESSALFDGEEAPMEMLEDVSFEIDKNGAPTEVRMEGFTAVFYIAMLTAYLPNKQLDEGDTYKASLKIGEMTYELKGKYAGHGKFEDKEYSMLQTESSLSDESGGGDFTTKVYFDKSKGRVVATHSEISTDDGDFVLTFKVK